MTVQYWSGTTTPYDPFVGNSAGLDRADGEPANLKRNSVWLTDTSGGPVASTTVASPSNSDEFMVRADAFVTGVNSITVNASAGQTIDGDATLTITTALAWSRHRYNEDTSNWELIGGSV